MSFVIGPYWAVEHPGGNHRSTPVAQWRGERIAPDDDLAGGAVAAAGVGVGVSIVTVGIGLLDTVTTAVDAVEHIRHPHLLSVDDVAVDSERAALVSRWPPGGRLSELVGNRGPLTPAETVTVLIPVASALAALHAAGVRHGGVSPESVWFEANGRPLLGPVAVSHVSSAVNHGMPDPCRDVAPEVVRGERLHRGPATSAADIFSLGSLALFCLTGRSAWPADEPADVLVQSAAGLWPDLPEGTAPDDLVALVRAMIDRDPARRPDAVSVLEDLDDSVEPAPVAFTPSRVEIDPTPDRGVAESDAGGGVAAQVAASDSRPRRRPTPATTSTDRWRGWSEQDRSATRDTDPRPSVVTPGPGSRRLSAGRRAGIVIVCGVLVALVLTRVASGGSVTTSPGSAGGSAASPADVTPPTDVPPSATGVTGSMAQAANAGRSPGQVATGWAEVVDQLDAARARALAIPDAGALAEVYTPESAAMAADRLVVDQLVTRGWHVVDARHQIASVHQLASTTEQSAPAPVDVGAQPAPAEAVPADPGGAGVPIGGEVRLVVLDALPGYSVADAAGQAVGQTQARAQQQRVLVLRRTDVGYRISAIESG